MKHEIDLSVFWGYYLEKRDEYDKKLYEKYLELEIKKNQEKGIELSQEEIELLEEKYHDMYINSNGRNLSKEDRMKSFMKNSLKDNYEEKKRLKEQHSVTNVKNINKSYELEKKLCKKYLVDNSEKVYLLNVEIREVYNKKSLLKFIRLMYIYEKALELGLTKKVWKRHLTSTFV